MISDTDLARLTAARERVDLAAAEHHRALAERDDLVRELLAAGVGATDIMRALGVNRSRIYQIRDQRR